MKMILFDELLETHEGNVLCLLETHEGNVGY